MLKGGKRSATDCKAVEMPVNIERLNSQAQMPSKTATPMGTPL
jgi:hypothetical protein